MKKQAAIFTFITCFTIVLAIIMPVSTLGEGEAIKATVEKTAGTNSERQRFDVHPLGVSFVALPAWKPGSKKPPFYEFKGPEGEISFHFAGTQAQTPEEALQSSITAQDKIRRTRPSAFAFVSSNAFITKLGLKGVSGSFGKMRDGRPCVIRHFLANAEGKIICVCNLSCYSKSQREQDLVEQSIVSTLETLSPTRPLR